MNSLCIKNNTLKVIVDKDTSKFDYSISLKKDVNLVLYDPFCHLVYFKVLYPLVQSRDKKKGIENVAYRLPDPDPWLIACAYIMWEGLLQCLTWEVIKVSVLKALEKLKKLKLAPTQIGSLEDRIKKYGKKNVKTEIGFSWTEFNHDGDPLKEFFIGLRRIYESKTKEERKIGNKK